MNEHVNNRMVKRREPRTRGPVTTKEILGEHTRPRVSPLAPAPMQNPPSTDSTPSTPSTETPFHRAAATAPAHQPEHTE